MKKLLVVLLVFTLILSVASPVFAKKPENLPEQANEKAKANYQRMLTKHEEKHLAIEKDSGVDKYNFYLSGDVMPTPPFGLADIEGSDIDSKLLVNQPNGDYLANLTGIMKGLSADTEYTVYLSNGYLETSEIWNVLGTYTYNFTVNDTDYVHILTIKTQENGIITGVGSHVNGTEIVTEVVNGTLIGDTLTLHIEYPNGYYFDTTLTIAEDGTFSGAAVDSNALEAIIGTVSGAAVKEEIEVSATTWTQLLSANIEAFTFITDEEVKGEWQVSIAYDDVEFNEDGYILFSVWINDGATILISDTMKLMEK